MLLNNCDPLMVSLSIFIHDVISLYYMLNILTSTKNASLIISDFLAMLYKNEQPRMGLLMFMLD